VDSRIDQLRAFLRSEVRALQPYEAEPAGPPIRLDANESPYDFPDDFKQEVLEGLRTLPWNRYPDPAAQELRRALARQEGVPAERIVMGNGSDEIIRDLITAYGGPGTRTVYPVPTFSMYRLLTLAGGGTPVGVRLNEDWSLKLESLLEELNAPAGRIAFLASPNNPTGNSFPPEQLEEILKSTDRLVVVDEAYRLYAGASMRSRLESYPNLAILNTFSKSMSLAGLRIGYLLADPEVIQALNRVRLPYNLDVVAQYVALRAVERPELWAAQAQHVRAEREQLLRSLAGLPEVTVYPSDANFILMRTTHAGRLRAELAAAGIAVRGFAAAEGLSDCLRVTVGKPEENRRFLQVCGDSLYARKG
jgi:histidinol-phosphate aminotransferase